MYQLDPGLIKYFVVGLTLALSLFALEHLDYEAPVFDPRMLTLLIALVLVVGGVLLAFLAEKLCFTGQLFVGQHIG